MSNSTLEFKNDMVTVSVTQKPDSIVSVDLSVTPAAVTATYHKAVKSVGKEISLPGFRKGKVPEAFIQKNYASYIEKEWQDLTINTAFNEVVKLTHLRPFREKDSIKKAEIKHLSRENGGTFVIEFETAPQIPKINVHELTLSTTTRPPLEEKEVDNAIHDIALYYAKWSDVTDRPIEHGDFVYVDVKPVDGTHNLFSNTRFEMVEGKIANWMYRLLLGVSLGESAEGMSEKDHLIEDFECHDSTHAHCSHGSLDEKENPFKPTLYKITVLKISTAVLPELEDLAKKTGLLTSSDLRKRVTDDLNTYLDEELQKSLRKQLDNLLLEKYSFDVPACLINEDKDFYVAEALDQESVNPEESAEDRIKRIEEKVKAHLKKSFQLMFLTHKIAADCHVDVSQDEFIHELRHKMITQQLSQEDIAQHSDEIRSRVRFEILERKTRDVLIKQIKDLGLITTAS